MNPNNNPRQQDERSSSTRFRTLLVLTIVVAALALPFAAGSVGAQESNETNQTEPAPYYDNTSTDVDNESWTAGNEDATFENITTYVSRIGTFVIGSDPGDNNAPTGPLIIGLMVLGAGLGVTVGSDLGIVSGAVLAVLSLAGVSAVGIFPQWVYAIGLFGVGLMLSASFKRVVG